MILRLLRLNYPFSQLFLWNCKLPQDFFMFFVKNKWKVEAIQLTACKIGKLLPSEINSFSFSGLQKLYLTYDLFDNRALKQIVKL